MAWSAHSVTEVEDYSNIKVQKYCKAIWQNAGRLSGINCVMFGWERKKGLFIVVNYVALHTYHAPSIAQKPGYMMRDTE